MSSADRSSPPHRTQAALVNPCGAAACDVVELRGLRDDLARASHRGDSCVLAGREALAAALHALDAARARVARLESAIQAVDRAAVRHRGTGTVVVGAAPWAALLAALAPVPPPTESPDATRAPAGARASGAVERVGGVSRLPAGRTSAARAAGPPAA
jgi:hypothetical protein